MIATHEIPVEQAYNFQKFDDDALLRIPVYVLRADNPHYNEFCLWLYHAD